MSDQEFRTSMLTLAEACTHDARRARRTFRLLAIGSGVLSAVLILIGVVVFLATPWPQSVLAIICWIGAAVLAWQVRDCLRDAKKFPNKYLSIRQDILNDLEKALR